MTAAKQRLGDVIHYIRGITFKPEEKVDPSDRDAVVCMRTKNVQSVLDESDLIAVPPSLVRRDELYLREGDILLSSANSWNLVGKVCRVPLLRYRATAGGFISVVRPRSRIDSRYLYHWLSSPEVQERVRACARQTTNISNLSVPQFEQLEIPVPPIVEQRRVADILDKADDIRRKRKESLALTEELLRSTFLEMFGDPVTNPMGWHITPLGEILEKIDSGWSPICDARTARKDEWGVLKLGAVTYGRYDEHQNKAMGPGLSPMPELEVKSGDVLFSRKNTYEHVAACVFVGETRAKLMLPDLIFRLVPSTTSGLLSETLWAMLSNPRMRSLVQGLASGTSGSMPNISKERLRTVGLPIPPLELQAKFASALRLNESTRRRLGNAAAESEALFDSLVARAFSASLGAAC